MAISSRSNVKSGFCFIKQNFGSIWLMMLKVFISALPLFLIMGASLFALIDLDDVMGASQGVGSDMASPPAGGVFDMVMAGLFSALLNLTTAKVALSGIAIFAGFIIIMLASSAMMVAMVRSIVLNQPLDTAIFSKLFDKTVLKYFGVSFLLTLIFMGVAAAVAALGFMLHKVVFALGLIVIYLALRLALVLHGVAVGDINSASEALSKTKGQIWNVFKVIGLSVLAIIVFQLIFQGLSFALGSIAGSIGMILAMVMMVITTIIVVPLQQIPVVAMAYLYKAIR